MLVKLPGPRLRPMSTSLAGSATPAGGRKRRACAIVKIVVFAPIPIAIEAAAMTVNSGCWRSCRAA